jgi:hypothetical protein
VKLDKALALVGEAGSDTAGAGQEGSLLDRYLYQVLRVEEAYAEGA